MDNNGGGTGWFFDSTPADDTEFTGIANSFQASFVDATTIGQSRQNDFYRTIAHEIGHALGIFLSPGQRLFNMTTDVGDDPNSSIPGDRLRQFNSTTGPIVITTNGGGHIFEGNHPNDLMNPGRTVPAGQPNQTPPIETTRQFISDLNVQLLADAYGYSVTLPSTFDTAHATLDSLTGTLLVQGRTGGLNDTINVDVVGSNIRVQVNGTTELVPQSSVTQIVIAGHWGNDTITVAPALQPLRQDVRYVVSSNDDAIDSGPVGNGVVDLDTVVPGYQVALRSAIHDIGSGTAAIFVPRGTYHLDISGTAGITEGDLGIAGDVTIVGAGAGATIIDAGMLATPNRVFVVNTNGASLNLSRLTVTGGNAANSSGGGIYAQNNTSVTLDQVAIVGNHASSHGGGVFVGTGANVTIINSVITENTAGGNGGGVIAVGSGAHLAVGSSIFANNTAAARADFHAAGGATVGDQGENMIGVWQSDQTGLLSASNGNLLGGNADYVVTSLVDSFDHSDDDHALSLREAIDLANEDDGHTSGTAETIWLPAWNFVLTRDRDTYGAGSPTDTDVEFGDLDIKDSLNIRGITAGLTKVQWKHGEIDAVFDLLGDYNGNGTVGSPDDGDVDGQDLLKWQQQYLSGVGSPSLNTYSADGDDDGDVDAGDRAIWQAYYGNELALDNLTEVLA